MLFSLAVYLCCGAVAGVLAGLLGVGGGIVIVPMLVAIFPSQGVPPHMCSSSPWARPWPAS